MTVDLEALAAELEAFGLKTQIMAREIPDKGRSLFVSEPEEDCALDWITDTGRVFLDHPWINEETLAVIARHLGAPCGTPVDSPAPDAAVLEAIREMCEFAAFDHNWSESDERVTNVLAWLDRQGVSGE
jgi:hypothetical protein